MKQAIENVDLIIFGDYSVLTNTPFRDHAPLHMLPGRAEYLDHLREQRKQAGRHLLYAVAGNKGGVAFGIQSEAEAEEEVRWTSQQIGAAAYRVCYAHPAPGPGYEKYADPEELKRRKPLPGMIEEIIAELGMPRQRVLIVGNYSDDCRAAKKAGLAWELAGNFFSQATPPAEDLKLSEDFDPFLEER